MTSCINYGCNEYNNCDHVMIKGNCNGCGNNTNIKISNDIINRYYLNDILTTNELYKDYQSVKNSRKSFEIKDVIFNDPATIVFWKDGSKTVVKCKGKDTFDPEKGLAMAIVKKVFGNKGNYYNHIKKWIES